MTKSSTDEFEVTMSAYKKRVVMISTSAADPNVRMDMEIEMLAEAGYDVAVLGWDREGTYPRVERRSNRTLYKLRLKAPPKGGRRIIFYWPIWWCVAFIWLIRNKWDIVHTADLDAFVPALLAAKLKRKPVIYDIYDVYSDSVSLPEFARWMALRIEKLFTRLAKVVIMTSEGHRHRLNLDSSDKVNLIYNICKYVPGNVKPRDNKQFRVFYAGTLFKHALLNLDKIIKAVGDMKEVKLTIAGYGDDYEEELKQLVKDGDISNVEFKGKISREDVLAETMNSDLLFVLYDPDLPINAISLPHKLFDALTYGKPILVPEKTVLGRFVKTHNCGIPVNCRSPEDIRAAITLLKEDREFYNQLVAGAKKAYEQEFNWQAMSQRLMDIYDRVLEKKA